MLLVSLSGRQWDERVLPAALFGSASGTEWMEGEAKLSAIYVQEGEGGRGAAKEEDAAEEEIERAPSSSKPSRKKKKKKEKKSKKVKSKKNER